MEDDATTDDERAIRELVDTWLGATEAGDTATVLDLMTDDVIFTVPGQEPFGKESFETASEEMQGVGISGTSDVREIEVLGDWAYLRNYGKSEAKALPFTVVAQVPLGGGLLFSSGPTVRLISIRCLTYS